MGGPLAIAVASLYWPPVLDGILDVSCPAPHPAEDGAPHPELSSGAPQPPDAEVPSAGVAAPEGSPQPPEEGAPQPVAVAPTSIAVLDDAAGGAPQVGSGIADSAAE